jgi:hypothetical protein
MENIFRVCAVSLPRLCLIALATIFSGCAAIEIAFTSRVFEVDDVGSFKMRYQSSVPVEIRLTDIAMTRHSAMGVSKIDVIQVREELRIIFYGAFSGGYAGKTLIWPIDYICITIPDTVDLVTFGNKRTVLWNRHEDIQTEGIKKFGSSEFPPFQDKFILKKSKGLTWQARCTLTFGATQTR